MFEEISYNKKHARKSLVTIVLTRSSESKTQTSELLRFEKPSDERTDCVYVPNVE